MVDVIIAAQRLEGIIAAIVALEIPTITVVIILAVPITDTHLAIIIIVALLV